MAKRGEPSGSPPLADLAAADLQAYELLAESGLPSSHRLHYLQRWLEAYLWLPDSAADDLRTKHKVVDKILPQIIRQHWRRIGFTRRPDMDVIRQLCREIDLLPPQVDDNGRRPDNVEYPWTGATGDVEGPARWWVQPRQRPPALLRADERLAGQAAGAAGAAPPPPWSQES